MKHKITILLFVSFLLAGMFLQAQPAKDFYKDSANYQIKALNINTDYSDLGVWPIKDGIIFMSNREHPRFSSFINHTDVLTNERFYALYLAKREKNDSTKFSNASPYHDELQVKYNSGPITISKDGKTMILTRNVLKKKQADKRKDEGKYRFILQLFQYTYNEKKKKWENETAFPYNSNTYNCAHAFLSADGNRLYFSNDMLGGFGGMDIYVCEKNGNSWGNPVNMGPIVNSSSNEVFPSLNEDGYTLYFSSDRQGGMGGLDIYSCYSKPNQVTEITNLGYPLNSSADDFGLIYYKNAEEGYFSSNRLMVGQEISKGKDCLNDNIYFVKSLKMQYTLLIVERYTNKPLSLAVTIMEKGASGGLTLISDTTPKQVNIHSKKTYEVSIDIPKFGIHKEDIVADLQNTNIVIPVDIMPVIKGVVKNSHGELLSNADVTAYSLKGHIIPLKTDLKGQFEYKDAIPDLKYTFLATKYLYDTASAEILIPLSPLEREPIYEVELVVNFVKRLTLSAHVLFDLDKYNLRPEAKAELDSIVPVLLKYKNIKLSLEGHTDSRGSAAYNQTLSENRVKSVYNYLVEKGVASNRITYKGYGLTRLLNQCKKGVKCTDEEHQVNRRVEFLFSEKKIEKF